MGQLGELGQLGQLGMLGKLGQFGHLGQLEQLGQGHFGAPGDGTYELQHTSLVKELEGLDMPSAQVLSFKRFISGMAERKAVQDALEQAMHNRDLEALKAALGDAERVHVSHSLLDSANAEKVVLENEASCNSGLAAASEEGA